MLVITALRTAGDRLIRFAPRIMLFAAIVLLVQFVVRGAAALADRFGVFVGVLAGVLAFIVVAYLSFVALRFSYRTLDHPVFDFSLDKRGVFRLMIVEMVLLVVSLPSLLLPLALAFSFVDLPEQVPRWLAIQLPPFAIIILVPLALISIYVFVRLTMAGFRTVVLREPPLAALSGSWAMTRSAFFALLVYSLIPLVLIFVFSILLVLVAVPFAFIGPVGILMIAILSIILSVVYLLVIDPSLAIGKAKLFEELSGISHKTHKGRR